MWHKINTITFIAWSHLLSVTSFHNVAQDGDPYLNDCLVTFIEREMLLKVKECDVINHFQATKERRIKSTLPSHEETE
jgi:hypothetical protein